MGVVSRHKREQSGGDNTQHRSASASAPQNLLIKEERRGERWAENTDAGSLSEEGRGEEEETDGMRRIEYNEERAPPETGMGKKKSRNGPCTEPEYSWRGMARGRARTSRNCYALSAWLLDVVRPCARRSNLQLRRKSTQPPTHSPHTRYLPSSPFGNTRAAANTRPKPLLLR